jgi:PRTRC genetic system protein C
MQLERTKRRFFYLGLELADINEQLTPEQVRDSYCSLYPEIVNASVEGPEVVDGELQYRISRILGTKG